MLRNLSWLAAAHFLVKPAWLVFMTVGCGRLLGLRGYGEMAAALALTTVLSLASDLGTADHFTREAARSPERLTELLRANLRLRLGVGIAVVAVAVGLAVALAPPVRDAGLYAAAAVYAIGLRLLDLCRAVYRSAERMRDEAVSIVVERALSILLGGLALWGWRSPRAVVMALAMAAFLSWGGNMAWIRRAYVQVRAVTAVSLRALLYETRWFGVYALTAPLFLSSGPVLLEALQGTYAAGVYSISSRLVEAAQLLPALLSAVLLPRMSREVHADARWRTARRLLLTSGAAGALAMVGLIGVAPWLAPWFAPGRTEAEVAGIVHIIRLTAVCLPLLSLCFVANTALLGTGRTAFAALWQCVCAGVIVGLQLWLIPRHGVAGAVWGLLLSLVVLLGGVLTRLHIDMQATRRSSDAEPAVPTSTPSSISPLSST